MPEENPSTSRTWMRWAGGLGAPGWKICMDALSLQGSVTSLTSGTRLQRCVWPPRARSASSLKLVSCGRGWSSTACRGDPDLASRTPTRPRLPIAADPAVPLSLHPFARYSRTSVSRTRCLWPVSWRTGSHHDDARSNHARRPRCEDPRGRCPGVPEGACHAGGTAGRSYAGIA